MQPDQTADATGCLACGGVFIALIITLIVVNIALLVWTARDAKNRGMDGAVVWMLLVFFLGPIGLVIYIFSRPKGEVLPCPRCSNKRLEASIKCPHCGSA